MESSPNSESKTFYDSLSIKKYPEFGKNHVSYSDILNIKFEESDDRQFEESLKSMLSKPIDVLGLLTDWQKGKLKGAGIHTIEELHLKTEDQLIENIYKVGPHRARLMKNAANAELLEYLSG
ncbi:hypothetical protein [Desulforhopalus sp. IMCC35007]|uniref:hypothetical protein n=1 Tax=Desulforhopalus sp. IMCC35007 TaxID=2569543 RepID=UPI0010AEC8CC|nr:hypothetical protein [Desulforhopalus sp. IMCC35007]TKB05473.1 hypothetical protein FCL48_24665 [Desulforhopalus sp. IMCC35007]